MIGCKNNYQEDQMFTAPQLFKNPVLLEPSEHKNLKILKPKNYSFMQGVDALPIGFTEILPATMYYPVIFGMHEGILYPFAVLGVQGKNPYLTEDGLFKIDFIPKIATLYPFGLVWIREEDREDFIVAVDQSWQNDSEGEELFDELGEETFFLKMIKEDMTHLALDLKNAIEFTKEIFGKGCLKQVSFVMEGPYGKAEFKNVYIADIEAIRRLQPERLYFFHSLGYLPVLYAIYFSVRNFRIFEILFGKK